MVSQHFSQFKKKKKQHKKYKQFSLFHVDFQHNVCMEWSLQGNLEIGALFQLAKESQREFPVVTQLIQVQQGVHPNS